MRDRPAAFTLGAIERGVRVGQKRCRVVAIARVERHADAEVDVQRVAVDFDRLAEGVAHSAGQEFCGSRQRHLFGDGNELVAAHARDVGALSGLPQPSGGLPQHGVARRMPEQVVDFLEAIQIDAKNGEGAAGIPGMLHRCGKAGVECGAIGQTRSGDRATPDI